VMSGSGESSRSMMSELKAGQWLTRQKAAGPADAEMRVRRAGDIEALGCGEHVSFAVAA